MPGQQQQLNEVGEQYALDVALIYVFNLIVGTGALTMPRAIADAGSIVGVIMILFIAFMSFVTATFTIECMAASNAIVKWNRNREVGRDEDEDDEDDDDKDDRQETVGSRLMRLVRVSLESELGE